LNAATRDVSRRNRPACLELPLLDRGNDELAQPLEAAPLLFGEKETAKLYEGVCPGIIERREKTLTVLNGQRDDPSLERERLLKKGPRRFLNKLYELADIVVRNVQAGEIHLPSYRVSVRPRVVLASTLPGTSRSFSAFRDEP